MRRYRTFKKIANIVRTVEVIVAIMFVSFSLSFTSSYLPAVIEFGGAFFRRIFSLLFCPHFVFLIGNVIIITLFAKSSSENKTSDQTEEELSGAKIESVNVEIGISGENNESDNVDGGISGVTEKVVSEVPAVEEREMEEKVYRRTKSTSEMVVVKEEKKELRRSETEVGRKIEKTAAIDRRRENRWFEVDELSNEEFNRKVEAFIQKQQRFLREEKLAVVLSN
uniref:DUF4408 domain-containing protein n=2 Tax=Chenopodium quinoa TaxID=63459 RepID=A0A803MZY9_CHEQI